jgi:hypothetical protein
VGNLLALLLSANSFGAILDSVLVAIITAVMEYQGHLTGETVYLRSAEIEDTYCPYGWFSVAHPCFLSFYWHRVPTATGCGKNYLFDKPWVHQSDEEKKQAGFLSLAADIANTECSCSRGIHATSPGWGAVWRLPRWSKRMQRISCHYWLALAVGNTIVRQAFMFDLCEFLPWLPSFIRWRILLP